MAEYNLGDWVTVTGSIFRDGWPHRAWRRTEPCKPYRVMVVGKRTLANGYVDVIKEGDGWGPPVVIHQWIPEAHFTAYLVVADIYTRPFYVRPEQVHLTEEATHDDD